MPAVLNEAFASPFNKIPGGYNQGPLSSESTYDIRNTSAPPMPPSQPAHVPYGYDNRPSLAHQQSPSFQPHQQLPSYPAYQQNYRITDSDASSEELRNVLSTMDAAERQHDCDRLISQIMSCSVCRKKLQAILAAQAEEDHVHVQSQQGPQGQQQSGGGCGKQRGGFMGYDISTELLVNFMIGVAVIFLLSRILSLKHN